MTDRARRFAAIGMLIASCAAILATTPGEPTASARVEGDVGVGPGESADVVARFTVAPSDQMDRGSISFFSGFFAVPLVDQQVTAAADGLNARREEGTSGFILPMHVCRDGCEVELRAVLTWIGEPGDRLRARWNAELTVVYENSVPSGEPVTATITEGHGPPAGRNPWLLVGAIAAALTGTTWFALGRRFAWVRIGLAALGILPPLWFLAQVALLPDPFFLVDYGSLLLLAAAVSLVLGTALGSWLTARGNPFALPAAGWANLVIVAWFLIQSVTNFSTYRPHEVALLTLGVLMPGVAAVAAVPPGRAPASGSLKLGTSFVLAAVLAELAATAGIAVLLIVAFAMSLAQGRAGDPTSIVLGLIPIAVTIGFVVGLRRWWAGSRLWLGLASGATLLVLVALLLFVFGGQGGVFVFSDEAISALLVCFVVNLLGLIGLVVFPTPAAARPGATPADNERRDERWQRDQVGRVLYEPDVEGSGDGA